MGMFQPQNYGRDFNESMIGMGNFIAGQKKADADLQQRSVENSRAERTLSAQEASSKAAVENSSIQTEKLKREEASAQLLRRLTPILNKADSPGTLTDDDQKTLVAANVALPYVPNNIEDFAAAEQAHKKVLESSEFLKSLPANDKPFRISVGDTPESDDAIKAVRTLISPDRYKEHADSTGSVTGVAGAKYRTDDVHSLLVQSGDGSANVVAYFSVVDANGKPIYRKDATGNDTPERVVVPSTIGQSNDPNAKLNLVPVDALQAKSALALQQMQAVKALSPEQKARFKKDIEAAMYANIPGGVEKLLASQTKDNTPIALADGGMLVSRDGKMLVENPKAEATDKVPTRNTYKKDGFEVTEEWDAVSKTWKPVGKNKIKDPPDPDRKDRTDRERRLKDDIDSSFKDFTTRRTAINKERSAYLKTYDPKDATSVAGLEDLNSRIADVENLSAAYTEKAAAFKKEFGYVYQPGAGAVNKVSAKKTAVAAAPQTPPTAQQKTPAPTIKPAIMDAMPPAAQASGRTIKDTVSGKRYKSNGTAWVEVK